MTNEIVLSKVDVKKHDVNNEELWKNAFQEDEVTSDELTSGKWFKYVIQFNGLKPVQITKKDKI